MKKCKTKLFIAAGLIAGYLVIGRPVRVLTSHHIVKPIFQATINTTGSTAILGNGDQTVAIPICRDTARGGEPLLLYRPPAGFFFLLSLVALVFITGTPPPYLYLVGGHLIAFPLVILTIIAGFHSFHIGFLIADLLITYLVPVYSIALVPLTLSDKQK